jgi:hypothetical protein
MDSTYPNGFEPVGRFHGTWTAEYDLSTSDRRLKGDIRNLEDRFRSDTITAGMRPVSFQYLDNERSRFGFVAQDLQRSLPELIREFPSEGADGRQESRMGVVYNDLLAVLTTMIQGLVIEKSALQPRLQSVEERIRKRKRWKRAERAQEKLRVPATVSL